MTVPRSTARSHAWRDAGLCVACGGERPPDRTTCDACADRARRRTAAYRGRNPELVLASNRVSMSVNRDTRRAKRVAKRAADPEGARAQDAASNRARRIRDPHAMRDYARAVRREVIAAYGGACECCGETQFEFLAIDHIYGDGKAERKAQGGTYGIFLKLRREGWPKGRHRILCHNCNSAVGFYGACPHQQQPPILKVV